MYVPYTRRGPRVFIQTQRIETMQCDNTTDVEVVEIPEIPVQNTRVLLMMTKENPGILAANQKYCIKGKTFNIHTERREL